MINLLLYFSLILRDVFERKTPIKVTTACTSKEQYIAKKGVLEMTFWSLRNGSYLYKVDKLTTDSNKNKKE